MRDDAGDVVPDQVRPYVAALIEAWQSGARRPDDIFSDARASWLSGRWPKAFERGHDAIGMELLFFLASARDMALGDGDIPALRTYLASTDLAKAQQRFFEHWETTGIETREAAGKLVDYSRIALGRVPVKPGRPPDNVPAGYCGVQQPEPMEPGR